MKSQPRNSGTTAVELLVFLFFCVVAGFVGHLFSRQWGWLAGIIPAMAFLSLLAFFEFRNLYLEVKAFISGRPGR